MKLNSIVEFEYIATSLCLLVSLFQTDFTYTNLAMGFMNVATSRSFLLTAIKCDDDDVDDDDDDNDDVVSRVWLGW